MLAKKNNNRGIGLLEATRHYSTTVSALKQKQNVEFKQDL